MQEDPFLPPWFMTPEFHRLLCGLEVEEERSRVSCGVRTDGWVQKSNSSVRKIAGYVYDLEYTFSSSELESPDTVRVSSS